MSFFYSLLDIFLTRNKLFYWTVLVFFLGLGVSVVYRGGFEIPKRTDLTVYLAAGEAIRDGSDIYAAQNSRGWNYLYPPLLAIALSPLARLPLPLLVISWYALSLAALYGSVSLMLRMFAEYPGARRAVIAGYALTLPCLMHTLARGQVGVLALFLIIAVFYFHLKERPMTAGILLALAIVLKPSPAAFIIFFFILSREWVMCLWTAIGALFFVYILPSLCIGFQRNQALLVEWLHIAGQATSSRPFESHAWHQAVTPFAPDNQSLYALVMRLFWGSEQKLFVSPDHLTPVLMKAAAALSLVMLAFFFHHGARYDKKSKFAIYSLFSSLMLFFSPVSEMHHYTVLFLMFTAGFLALGDADLKPLTRRALIAGLWTAFIGYTAGLIYHPAGWWGMPVLGSVALFFCLARYHLDSNLKTAYK